MEEGRRVEERVLERVGVTLCGCLFSWGGRGSFSPISMPSGGVVVERTAWTQNDSPTAGRNVIEALAEATCCFCEGSLVLIESLTFE